MNLYTEKVSPLFKSGKYYGNTCFLIDSKGYIWLAYGKGVWKINLENEEDKVQYRSGENGLGTFPISQIIEDKEGRIFLGTRGSGLFHYETRRTNGLSDIQPKIASSPVTTAMNSPCRPWTN